MFDAGYVLGLIIVFLIPAIGFIYGYLNSEPETQRTISEIVCDRVIEDCSTVSKLMGISDPLDSEVTDIMAATGASERKAKAIASVRQETPELLPEKVKQQIKKYPKRKR